MKKGLAYLRDKQKKEREDRLKRRMKATGEIEILQYKFIEKGFYEVLAITWHEKISFEGNMCGGLLKKFIKEVLAGGGKVEKVRHSLVEHEAKEELKQAEAELKELRGRIKKATKILDY